MFVTARQNVVGLGETAIKEVLETLGLTGKEAEVYIVLAKHGPLKGVELAKQLRKHKAQIYRILKRLQTKNLVESTLEAPTRFTAISFEKVLDQFIKIKQEEAAYIERTKEDWLKDWERIRKARIQPSIEKFVVIEGNKKIYSKILQMITQTKSQLSIILPVSGLARGEQFGVFDAFYEHPMKSEIDFRILTELSKQNLKAIKLLVPKIKSEIDFRATTPNLSHKLLPRMVIRDKKEILFFISPKTEMFSTGRNESCLFINSKSLVETLTGTFEDLWKDSIYVEDKILEIETGKQLPEPFVEKGIEIVTNYDVSFSSVKEQVRSFPLLSAQISRIERSLPNLVGRQEELRQLDEFLEKALEGKGNTIFIHGEAGIGKTRLVNELILHALSTNIRIITCNCSQDSGVPLLPFKKILKDLFYLSGNEDAEVRQKKIREQIEDLDPHFMSLIPVVDNLLSSLTLGFGPYSDEIRINSQEDLAFLLKSESAIANLAKLLISFSAKHPLLLFVDDMHLADSSSLKLLKNLAKKINKSNLLLLGAYRQDAVIKAFEGVTHPFFNTLEALSKESLSLLIELKRLERSDCSKLITNMLGIDNYKLGKLIYQETEGNPFFILETIKFLINKKFLVLKGEKWELVKNVNDLEIPHTIRDVISRRIYILKEEERDVLDCASVIGEQFTSDLIEDITGFNRLHVLKRLNKIERKYQLIHSLDDRYMFDHSKIREVLYQDLTPELRKEYHSLFAEKLEETYENRQDEVINQLAYHFYNSGNAKKAVPYLLRAGQKSRNEYSLFEAIQYFSQALEVMKDYKKWDKERTVTFEELGDLYGLAAEHEKANECYRKGIASTSDKLVIDKMQRKIRKKKIVENDGVKIAYYVQGQGEITIVFLAWSGTTEMWNSQVNFFSQKYKVVTVDMRGTGESDKPPSEYTIDLHMNDLRSVIENLQANNIILIGFYIGGMTAIKYVANNIGKISKLVLWATNPAPMWNLTNSQKKGAMVFRQNATKFPSWGVRKYWETCFPRPGSENFIEWGLKSTENTPPEIFMNCFLNHWNEDVRSLLSKVNVPTLILQCETCVVPVKKARYLHENISGSKLLIRRPSEKSIGAFPNIFEGEKYNKILDKFITTGEITKN
jgi:sugar-specific transcriptional regulator TrmB/pimeloyl-ACP methyl ester carboxylesterase